MKYILALLIATTFFSAQAQNGYGQFTGGIITNNAWGSGPGFVFNMGVKIADPFYFGFGVDGYFSKFAQTISAYPELRFMPGKNKFRPMIFAGYGKTFNYRGYLNAGIGGSLLIGKKIRGILQMKYVQHSISKNLNIKTQGVAVTFGIGF